jgi:hypothetical protein
MTTELIEDLVAYHRELSSVKTELGRLARDLALLSAAVADLKRDWPAANIVLVDEANIN